MGSGKGLKAAIKKYGKENFEREILFRFDNEDDMNLKEIELLESIWHLAETYNEGPGGEGGAHFKGRTHSEATKAKISAFSSQRRYKKSTETLKKERERRYIKNNGSWFSQETIEKIRLRAKMRGRAVVSLSVS